MKFLSTASAIALAAALAAAPAMAASPAGSTSAATTPGTGNPAHAPVNNAPNGPANNTAAAAGSAGTAATTNPGALGTAPNPGPGTPPNGHGAYPAAPGAGTAGNAMAPGAAANANNNTPSNRNPVLTKGGKIRASKVIGSAVYNSKDQQVGTIDDILLTQDSKKAATAVISVGGFLGIGAKLVTVPYDKLQFGNANKNGDNRVVMPDASKDALNKMPSYQYTSNNGNNG